MSIEDLFDMAETNSAQLRPSITAEEEARREISEAKSGRLPDVNLSMSFSYIGDGFTVKRDFSDYRKAPIPHFGNGLSLNISQPVYTGGTLTNTVELAKLKSTATRYATELCRDDIRFRIAGNYLDIYKYHNLRDVVESNIGRAKKVLSEIKARHDQGLALYNDVTRYELLVSTLELQLIQIDNMLDILNKNISVTVGLPDGTVIIPDTALLSRSLPVNGEKWWKRTAVENSPTLLMAKTVVDINRKSEDIVRSGRLPKVALQAGWTIDGPILVEVPPINRNLSYWYVGIGVSYNISSLYKNNKSLSRSRVATRRAVEQLEASRDNVELAVRADYVRYLEAFEEFKTLQKSVELAEQNYDIVQTRFTADMVLITDMLDAANSKLEAERNLVNARINIIYYYYKLLFTSGTI